MPEGASSGSTVEILLDQENMDVMRWTYISSHIVGFLVCLVRMNPEASDLVTMLDWQ